MNNDKIPKIIHYCWFGRNPKSELINKCINSWKKFCPDYEIIEWNEDNFDININKFVKEAYSCRKWAFVTDYVRLYVIYNYGGIYLDTDVELLASLDSFLKCDSFFSSEDNKTISTGLGFGAKKNNNLVKMMMDDYDNLSFILKNNKYNDLPCPMRNTSSIKDIINSLGDRSRICKYNNNLFYPKEYFCPIDTITGDLNLTSKTVAIHHFSGTWLNSKEKKKKLKKQYLSKKYGNTVGKIYMMPYTIRKRIRINGFFNTFIFGIRKIFGGKNETFKG